MAVFIASLILVVVSLVAFLYVLILGLRLAAENDFIFTLVKEGTAKAVVGTADGGFQKMLMQYTGHHLSPDMYSHDCEVTKGVPARTLWNRVLRFLGLTGVMFLGLPGTHTIHKYNFRWASLKTATGKEDPQVLVDVRDDPIKHILVQEDMYFVLARGAEDNGKVPFDIGLLLTIAVTHPYRALWRIQKWLEAVENQSVSAFRRLIGTLKWTEFQSGLSYDLLEEDAWDELRDHLMANRDQNEEEERFLTRLGLVNATLSSLRTLRNRFTGEYGIEIRKLQVSHIDPSGERGQAIVAAATKGFEAEREAERIARVYGEIARHGDIGPFVQLMETLREASNKQGNMILPLLPLSLPQWLKGLNGGDKNDKRSSS